MVGGAGDAGRKPRSVRDEEIGPAHQRVRVRVLQDGADGSPWFGVPREQGGRPLGLGEAVILGEDDDRSGSLADCARAHLAGGTE